MENQIKQKIHNNTIIREIFKMSLLYFQHLRAKKENLDKAKLFPCRSG